MTIPRPFFSCVCVTCARVEHLQAAIAAFLAQDYDGQSELLILNTCPRQTLNISAPRVRIINLERRPASLGEARNMAIEAAQGTHIVIWDDDDYFLPHHLTAIANGFQNAPPDRRTTLDPNKTVCEWIWLGKQFWGWGDTIKEIVPGQCPCFSFSKDAWRSVGKYPDLTVGEDRSLISRITTRFPGALVKIEGMPSFIYRWSNNVYHTSGESDDTPERQPAHARYWADALVRLNSGKEPHGNVYLKPHSSVDWPALAQAFMDADSKKKSVNSVCIVQLGRFGDIINILPIARHLYLTTGEKPHIMINREFSRLLEGVSYAAPKAVTLNWLHLNTALELAKQQFGTVVESQICGQGYTPKKRMVAFNHESWYEAGFASHFHDAAFPLVFDRRNAATEAAVRNRLFRTNKPKIVTNLTAAFTAPFHMGRQVALALQATYGATFEIVDIGTLKLPHVYDLLGAIEHAKVFVSIDTATLHLAAAAPVPLVALVRNGWEGALPRFNCAARLTYDNATPERVCDAVGAAIHWNLEQGAQIPQLISLIGGLGKALSGILQDVPQEVQKLPPEQIEQLTSMVQQSQQITQQAQQAPK